MAAKDAFAGRVARAPYYHEFHFWLAAAHLGARARRRRTPPPALAVKNSTTRRDHELYAAKLDRLNQLH